MARRHNAIWIHLSRLAPSSTVVGAGHGCESSISQNDTIVRFTTNFWVSLTICRTLPACGRLGATAGPMEFGKAAWRSANGANFRRPTEGKQSHPDACRLEPGTANRDNRVWFVP